MDSEYIELHKKRREQKEPTIPIHKIYLVLSILFGLIFSIAMPLFSEQDGQYHYVAASEMVNLSTNLSNYGEYTVGSGTDGQDFFYKNKKYFSQYYLQKIEIIPQKDIPRLPNSAKSKFNYDYFGHLIPALGVYIGHKIYPSLGVMVTVGRLLNMVFCSILLFFIIKWVKKGKEVFACILLSPVAINSLASLSYDAVNFVWVSMLIALAINMIVSKRERWKLYIPVLVIISIISFIWIKTNYLVLLAIFPIIIINKMLGEGIEKNRRTQTSQQKYHRMILLLTVASGIVGTLGLIIISYNNGGIGYILSRLWPSFGITYTTNQNIVSQTLLSQSNRGENLLPFWLSGVWFALMICMLLVQEKYVKSRFISWGALGIFIVSIIAVYLAFIPFGGVSSGQIWGVQGRYFTPLLPLLSIVVGNYKFKLKLSPQKPLIILMAVIVVFSNSLVVINTLTGMYGLFS
ncbi:DUF2142 domain-containing protein [Lactococcus cremoris]|uniref:DUF2142 domain-containing protein n=1 Tax=Lactococcus cremoris subsp. tructae TaxID=542833 RepID=A0A2A5SSN0_LACLC|nr:DUF2142 domain-containing protein [Lactococcus cremoris]PCS18128.1 hypothetical protein RU92_GL002234 [Lactococcus cremoris subsp. tructae]